MTPGAKWYGTKLFMQEYMLTQCYVLIKIVTPAPPCPPCGVGPCAVGTWCCGRVFKVEVSSMLNMTSSHMWDNWYFPVFLLNDGPLTIICIASLLVLAML